MHARAVFRDTWHAPAWPACRARTIDGPPDCELPQTEIPRGNWRTATPLPADVWARVAVAWFGRGLYFFVHVNDPTRDPAPAGLPAFCGDAVHLFVDTDGRYAAPPRYDEPGTRQFQVAAPSNGTQTSRRGDVYGFNSYVGPFTSTRFVATPVKDGYTVEAFIDGADLGVAGWALSEGERAGYSLSVTLGDPKGTGTCDRLSDFALLLDRRRFQGDGQFTPPHASTDAFCNPRLGN
jgi:hypothetical protein